MKVLLMLFGLLVSICAFAGSADQANANASDQYNQQYQQASKTGAYQRNFNVRFLGSGVFVGFIGTAIDFQVRPSFTVGPMAKGFAFGEHNGYLLGVDAMYATNGNIFSSGFFINPYVGYYKSDYERRDSGRSGVIGANVGYQWMFSNSFNAQIGVGAYFANHPMPISINERGSFFPTFMLAVGYAF